MDISPEVDTGVSTINENIQSLLSKTDYPPSYITRVINRAIEGKRYKSYPGISGLRKGHFFEPKDLFHNFSSAAISVKFNGRQIEYKNWTMPSFEGQSVMYELDELIKKFDPKTLNADETYNLLAMMIVAVGSAHVFPDGSGRTAVGLADVLLRKYLGKRLDLVKLQSLDKRLTVAMSSGSMVMLPDQYNPNLILRKMSYGETRRIVIPEKGTHSLSLVQTYARMFAGNISKHIRIFDPRAVDGPYTDIFSLQRDSINPIASLLKEVTV